MARKDRTGNRKTREQRQPLKIPELGYYLVVTDTEATERCYFQGLHKELPKDIQNKLVIKVVETKTRVMIDKCLEMTAYDAQYRMPWIVFDRDEVKDFDEIIKEAEALGINVGWSNPCFEIWMYSYYGAMPAIMESWVCCDEFEKIFKEKQDKNIQNQMRDCMKRFPGQEMKKKLYKWQGRSMGSVFEKEKRYHLRCVHVRRFTS